MKLQYCVMQPCLRISPLPLVSPFSRATITEIRKYRLNCMVSSWQVYPYYPRVRRPHNKVCSSDKKGIWTETCQPADSETKAAVHEHDAICASFGFRSGPDAYMESKIILTNVMFPKIPHMFRQGVVVGCFWPGYDEATQANTKTSFLSPTETHLSR